MLATRDGFGDELTVLANENPFIVAMTADLTEATRLGKFKKYHPDRYIQMGIAEANMIGVASGLSEHGYRVFMTSFASFLTGRYDILRVSLGYAKAPVVVVGTHAGLAIGRDGLTQMGTEDLSLMRSMPNMQVLQPSTYTEARQITRYLASSTGLTYLRLGRQPVPDSLPGDYKFEFNKIQLVYSTTRARVCVLSTGCVLPNVLTAAKRLQMEGIRVDVYNVSTIKPLDEEMLVKAVLKYDYLATVEDHSIIGGLGSAVAEVTSTKSPCQVLRIGINDVFAGSGKPDDLYEKYGLSAESIYQKIKDAW